MIYVAFVRPNGSSTVMLKERSSAPTADQRRAVMQEAIDQGRATEAGQYVVASPDTAFGTLNASVFEVKKITAPRLVIA